MVAVIVLILLLLLLGGGALIAPALHILWILLLIGLILWVLGFFIRGAEGRGRWYGRRSRRGWETSPLRNSPLQRHAGLGWVGGVFG